MKKIQNILSIVAVLSVISFLAVSGAMANEKVVTGTVINTDQGVTLLTDQSADRLKIEGQDLSAMVGKSVHIIGTVEESPAGGSIAVRSVERANQW